MVPSKIDFLDQPATSRNRLVCHISNLRLDQLLP
jgi:hypothetical protein